MYTHLLGCDRLLGCLCQLFDRLRIMSQIVLAANENDGKSLAEMKDLGDPLEPRVSVALSCEHRAGMYTFS